MKYRFGLQIIRNGIMAEKLDSSETVSIEKLVVSHSYEMIALITVFERKGILIRGKVIEVIKEMRKAHS